jgi:hypothetical protein
MAPLTMEGEHGKTRALVRQSLNGGAPQWGHVTRSPGCWMAMIGT